MLRIVIEDNDTAKITDYIERSDNVMPEILVDKCHSKLDYDLAVLISLEHGETGKLSMLASEALVALHRYRAALERISNSVMTGE